MNDIDWTAFLWIWGLSRLVLFVAIAFGIKYAGKWFKAFRAEVSHHGDVCEYVHGEDGLRDRVETLETQMELLTKYLEKEHNITIGTIDKSTHTDYGGVAGDAKFVQGDEK